MKTSIDLSDLPVIRDPGSIVILKSKWYPDLVNNLSSTCIEVLQTAGYIEIEEHVLPGSLEIPLAARDVLSADVTQKIDAVICFGVIVKGDTMHFELISEESMRGLGAVMHEFRRPIIVEILPVYDIDQAKKRSADDEFNKGIEAAVAALEMVFWRRQLLSQ